MVTVGASSHLDMAIVRGEYLRIFSSFLYNLLYNISKLWRKLMYESYVEFEEAKTECEGCQIWACYKKVVPSDGCKLSPKVMVIGEAPGADEVEQGKPFVGKAGKLLRATLNVNGFDESNTIISNIICCRPEKNKFPKDDSLVRDCFDLWLAEEIKLTKPEYVITLGAQPLKFLLGLKGITKLRGQWYDYLVDEEHTAKCMPTFHPSYVLRKEHMKEGKIIMQNFKDDIEAVAIEAGLKE